MKIIIIGHSGCGKSTLAQQLADHYQLPKLHLDTLQFLPGWQDRPAADFNRDLRHFLDQHDRWVIDGVYSKNYFEERLTTADRIIYLNFNRWRCLYRVIKRYLTYRGQSRTSMAAGCPEKLDLDFIWWVLWYGRRPTKLRQFNQICQTYADKTLVFRHPKQLASWLHSLAETSQKGLSSSE